MATDVRNTTDWSSASNAQFQATIAQIHAALAAVGMVQTADTGQINPATATVPGGQLTAAGYEIWRFSDTLQASAPIFFKIEYGLGSWNTGTAFGIWVTVGTGTNGAGTLTGGLSVTSRVQLNVGPYDTASYAGRPSWASGAANRIGMILARANNSSNGNAFFSIERTKDANGADTGEGFHFVTRGPSNAQPAVSLWTCQTIIFAVTVAQQIAGGPMCVTSNDATANDGTNTGFFPWQMSSRRGAENPPIGWISYFFGDVAADADIPVQMYGTNRTYRTLGAAAAGSSTGLNRAGWRPSGSAAVTPADVVMAAMRWD